MRKLPDTLPMKKDVDWVPVDIVGKTVVELLFPALPDHQEARDGANTDHRVLPSEPATITAKEPNPATPTYDSTPATLPILKPPNSSHPASPSSSPALDLHRNPPIQSPTIYHLSNPHPFTFSSLIPTIQSACSTQLEIVALPHWLAELETAIENGEVGEEMSARSLLEFRPTLHFAGTPDPPSENLGTANGSGGGAGLVEDAVAPRR
ncbi:MAG: hypothetical protein LQ339_002329 [Xanthoria mediterranea]|nr:MAG: hypothetical protein LQ339_002329 [Xanthoria mediterranea]